MDLNHAQIWLETAVRMLPHTHAAMLVLNGQAGMPAHQVVWPTTSPVADTDLQSLLSFAQQGSRTSATSVDEQQVACACVPIKLRDSGQLVGHLCVKATVPDASARGMLSTLEWAAVWIACCLQAPAAPVSQVSVPVEQPSKVMPSAQAKRLQQPKMLALAGSLLLIGGMMMPVDYPISLKAHIKGVVEAPVVAPFDGFIEAALIAPGQTVQLHQPLVKLDDKALRLNLQRLESEQQEKEKRYRRALADGERGEAQVLKAMIAQTQAEAALARDKLADTHVLASLTGVVTAGDLRYSIGAPVKKGDTLFTITPHGQYKVMLEITESDYRYLQAGQHGQLKLASLPDHTLAIQLLSPSPLFTERNNQLIYWVEATFQDNQPSQLVPGMQGVARVDAGKTRLGWRLLRPLVDWWRMTFWTFKL